MRSMKTSGSSIFRYLSLPQFKRKAYNSWVAVQDTYLLTKVTLYVIIMTRELIKDSNQLNQLWNVIMGLKILSLRGLFHAMSAFQLLLQLLGQHLCLGWSFPSLQYLNFSIYFLTSQISFLFQFEIIYLI